MNFSTSIFNLHSPKIWVRKGITGILLFIGVLFSFNYVIDPYNMTEWNFLNIKYKFARDDRSEKLNYFKTLPAFDTIIIGSSRVYSINPRKASELIGGTTYNFGVGTATVEDHLGILLYLEKQKKLPKNLIIGVDFYTFNPDIPPNSYFLKNKELNFLSYRTQKADEYWPKFFSFDATRASVKTFKHHLFPDATEKPRFDSLGWGLEYMDDRFRNIEEEKRLTLLEIKKNKKLLYSDYRYSHIDPKRIAYYEKIRQFCYRHHIKLYVFTTPLHPWLLKELQSHPSTKNAMQELKNYLSGFEEFTDFYSESRFSEDIYLFNGATHTTARAGDLILEKVLAKPQP